VSNACLAHDIGNPPFGHAGEEAIGSWFTTHPDHEIVAALKKEEVAQFRKFEGNAQGFRLLTRLQQSRNEGGLKLTYATLGAFTKYPCTCSASKGKGGYIGEKKYGFFDEDLLQFVEIAHELGLSKREEASWSRHPLVFLVEAADDICYRVVDIEDGWKLGRLSFEEAEECFLSLLPDRSVYRREEEEDANIGWLRAKAISSLIPAVEDAYSRNETAIMAGTFSEGLIDATSLSGALAECKSLVSKRVFDWERTIDAEIAGVEMITTVLQKCMDAVVESPSKAGTLLRKTIPLFDPNLPALAKTHLVVDYVSGMTDSFLKQTYLRLTGHAHI
jgi:dGTPase